MAASPVRAQRERASPIGDSGTGARRARHDETCSDGRGSLNEAPPRRPAGCQAMSIALRYASALTRLLQVFSGSASHFPFGPRGMCAPVGWK